MNFKISSIRKEDGKVLYFFDDEVMEQYITDNGGADAFEFNGFQLVPQFEEVIDPDSWRKDVLYLMKSCGLDTRGLKKHEINGTDDPDEDEEAREKRIKEIMDINNRAAVYKIKDDGTLEETDDNVEEFAKEQKQKRLEESIDVLKKKAIEHGMNPDEIMGEGTDGERFNRLADAVWEKMKELGEIQDGQEVADELTEDEDE